MPRGGTIDVDPEQVSLPSFVDRRKFVKRRRRETDAQKYPGNEGRASGSKVGNESCKAKT